MNPPEKNSKGNININNQRVVVVAKSRVANFILPPPVLLLTLTREYFSETIRAAVEEAVYLVL